ncbi:MAG: penicillin-binding protein [marine bacterium B5-7]|nr:MAG: penicillin-binding protein [marine bacterium B5-7]
MLDLNVLNQAFLLGQGNARTLRTIPIPAYRGMVVDRHGKPLAISTPVESVWVDPGSFDVTNPQITALCRVLKINYTQFKSRLSAYLKQHKSFLYVKRRVSPELAAQVKQLNVPGVNFQHEYKRFYPEGAVTSHVIGFTNVDDQGQEGVELTFNQSLRGIPGAKRVVKDRMGHIVSVLNTVRKPQPGQDVRLSIDRGIQYLAYQALSEAAKEYQVKSGSLVVLDAKSGEILAMVNYPSFNPNNRPADTNGRYRNRAVTDVFEPGSTIKAFSVSNALMHSHYTKDSIIDTNPGWMNVDGKTVRDVHPHGKLNLTGVLQKSSNVGVTKLTFATPPDSLRTLLHSVGFGQQTGIHFPGESAGVLPDRTHWGNFALATLSFGYGLSSTTLQLAEAYTVIADQGVKRPVSLLKRDKPTEGKQIIPAKFANEVRHMLETVVEKGGTATRAQITGYRVSGKTGTVRVVGPHGYEKHKHIGFFVGMAPASNPRIVAAVVMNEPAGWQYYGGLVAAPVFSKVVGGALRALDVAPDKH